jgi:hypothetical protein
MIGISESKRMGDEYNGAFLYDSPVRNGELLRALASSGNGWDHVSVSLLDRCPSWEEMEWIKCLFFLPNEIAFQLHVPIKEHINIPYTLHLWRPHHIPIPLPPSIMV